MNKKENAIIVYICSRVNIIIQSQYREVEVLKVTLIPKLKRMFRNMCTCVLVLNFVWLLLEFCEWRLGMVNVLYEIKNCPPPQMAMLPLLRHSEN